MLIEHDESSLSGMSQSREQETVQEQHKHVSVRRALKEMIGNNPDRVHGKNQIVAFNCTRWLKRMNLVHHLQ